MEELRCKKCNRVLAEGDFQGLVRKWCKHCQLMNVFVISPKGIIYRFIELVEEEKVE
jgi:phage FluMu protein Com